MRPRVRRKHKSTTKTENYAKCDANGKFKDVRNYALPETKAKIARPPVAIYNLTLTRSNGAKKHRKESVMSINYTQGNAFSEVGEQNPGKL